MESDGLTRKWLFGVEEPDCDHDKHGDDEYFFDGEATGLILEFGDCGFSHYFDLVGIPGHFLFGGGCGRGLWCWVCDGASDDWVRLRWFFGVLVFWCGDTRG